MPFGSRPGIASECPRTCAPTSFAFAFATALDRRERLCQNIDLFDPCQPFCFPSFPGGKPADRIFREIAAAPILKERPALPEPISAREDFSPGLAMVFVLWVFNQG